MPELGDSCYGGAIGRNPKSHFYWVRCQKQASKDCLGDRWSATTKGRYERDSLDRYRYRTCEKCNQHRHGRSFSLPPKHDPTRPMD